MSVLLACAFNFISSQPVWATETTITFPRISEIYPNTPSESIKCTEHPDCEFVELYNPSTGTINLDQYSLAIKGNVAEPITLSGNLPAGSYVALSVVALRNSGATVQLLLSETKQIIEEVSYGSQATDDQSWSYFVEGWELTPVTKDAANVRFADEEDEPVDVCPATPEIDLAVPAGYEINKDGVCVPIATSPEYCHIEISEISAQPNFNGKEYIEFYNSSATNAVLEKCKVIINGGTEKIIATIELAPGARYVMQFSSGAIRNSAGTVTLIDSDNVEYEYTYQDTDSGEVVNFETGKRTGVVSNHPTPDAQNQAADIVQEDPETASSSSSSYAPCAEGKFRNPETNRCKNITSASGELTPCASDQVRNPETNRCKKISSSSTSLTPCQPDQFRNPATNRCKKISSESGGLKPCAANQERNPETNRCRKIATDVTGSALGAAAEPADVGNKSYKLPAAIVSLSALFGYAAYEYRSDISRRITQLREKNRPLRPPD